jgi:hypothetical protein
MTQPREKKIGENTHYKEKRKTEREDKENRIKTPQEKQAEVKPWQTTDER